MRKSAPTAPTTIPIAARSAPCRSTSREHVASLRAEGDAHADLLPALRDQVRDHAIDAERREHERRGAEHADQHEHETSVGD